MTTPTERALSLAIDRLAEAGHRAEAATLLTHMQGLIAERHDLERAPLFCVLAPPHAFLGPAMRRADGVLVDPEPWSIDPAAATGLAIFADIVARGWDMSGQLPASWYAPDSAEPGRVVRMSLDRAAEALEDAGRLGLKALAVEMRTPRIRIKDGRIYRNSGRVVLVDGSELPSVKGWRESRVIRPR